MCAGKQRKAARVKERNYRRQRARQREERKESNQEQRRKEKACHMQAIRRRNKERMKGIHTGNNRSTKPQKALECLRVKQIGESCPEPNWIRTEEARKRDRISNLASRQEWESKGSSSGGRHNGEVVAKGQGQRQEGCGHATPTITSSGGKHITHHHHHHHHHHQEGRQGRRSPSPSPAHGIIIKKFPVRVAIPLHSTTPPPPPLAGRRIK